MNKININGISFDFFNMQNLTLNLRLDLIMKNVIMVFLFSFLFVNSLLSQTTYYVSSSEGNDSNSGTSMNLAWKTLGKLNSGDFVPGDQILFKRSDIWSGNVIIKNSGTPESRITISAYGTGAKPIITLREPIPGWTDQSKWNEYSTNIWKILAFKGTATIERSPTRLSVERS